MSEAYSHRQWFENHPDFKAVPRTIAASGHGATLVRVLDQPPGVFSRPAAPEFSLNVFRAVIGRSAADFGGSHFIDRMRRHDCVLAPGQSAITVENDQRVVRDVLIFSIDLVAQLFPDSSAVTPDAFDRLHWMKFSDPAVLALMDTLCESPPPPNGRRSLAHDYSVAALIARLFALAQKVDAPREAAAGGLPPARLRRILERMADEPAKEPELFELAEMAGLGVKHFARAFKQSTGLAPHHWLLRHRIERAQALLADDVLSLADVALACGYADQSHFGTAFRKATGVSPGHYRRERRA